jgi:ERF superfamily protein
MSTELERSTGVSNPLVLLERMIEAKTDPDTMRKWMELAALWKKNQAEAEYNAAMSRCQAKMPLMIRDKDNKQTQSKYVRYESLNALTRPIYTAEGFSLNWTEGVPRENGDVHLICDVRHSAGHTVRHEGYFGLDSAGFKGTANKTPVQAKGSTYSYGRRYMEKFIWNLAEADEDNDGQSQNPLISPDEVGDINDLFEECRLAGNPVDKAKFFAWLSEVEKRPVESLDQMSRKAFDQARRDLNRKRKTKKGTS